MGKTNNSTIKVKDIVDSGGLRTVFLSDLTEKQLIKDIDITTGRKNTSQGNIMIGPLFHNVTLKNEYGDNHLTKFQDLDIAETYPITLHVTLPTTAWTGYTLYGFTASITYPNGSIKQKNINITETTSDTSIEIENCINNARVKILPPLLNNISGATISATLAGKVDADVEISPLFTEGDGVICTGPIGYPCFDLTRSWDVVDPVLPPSTGDTGTSVTTRKIDIYIDTSNVGLYKLLIDTASFGTGHTLSEVQDSLNLKQALIPELSKEITGLTISPTAVQATIEVPSDAYVAIRLSDPKGSPSNLINLSLYDWEQDNYQYVSPGITRESVTYTVTSYKID